MLRTCSLLIAAILFTTGVYAQGKGKQNDDALQICPAVNDVELQSISDEMYAAGNYKYIWVDLWKDGYVDPNEHEFSIVLHFSTKKDKEYLLVENTEAPKEAALRYAEKYRRFIATVKGTLAENVGMISPYNFTVANISDPASTFRNLTINDMMDMEFFMNRQNDICKELKKDGFMDSSNLLFLQCSQISLVVNHKDIEGDLYEKYKALFKEKMGIDITFPYHRYQNSTIQFAAPNKTVSSYTKISEETYKAGIPSK